MVCKEPLSFIRVDLIKHKYQGHLRYRYSMHIVCVYSGYHWIKFCQHKDDALVLLQQWVTQIERQTSRKIKVVGIDGGPEFGQATEEFKRSKLATWAAGLGISIFKTTPYTPWMNGKAERAGRSLVEKARTMMIAYNLPERL